MSEKTVTPILGGKKHTKPVEDFKNFKGNTHRTAIIDAMAASVTGQTPGVSNNGVIVAGTTAPPATSPAQQGAIAAQGTLPGVTKPKPEILIKPGDKCAEVDEDLVYILSQPRAHDGESEKRFINWLITKIAKMGRKAKIVQEGAIYVEIGTSAESHTLFSCHIDTVHSVTETAAQDLVYDPNVHHILLAPPKQIPSTPATPNTPATPADPKWHYKAYEHKQHERSRTCLGADDGAGVWILLKMLEANVPGGYLFHRGEERGCISSAAMARHEQKFLGMWKAAVAFDRPKDFEVITHQGGAKCASNEYAKALAEALSGDPDDTLKFQISAQGGTTDTRQYRNIIPECINVGVGYFGHHTPTEYLDYEHLVDLKNRCIKIDWNSFPITRDPKETETYGYGSSGSYHSHNTGSSSYPKTPAGANNASAGTSSTSPGGSGGNKAASLPSSKKLDEENLIELLYNEALSESTILDWFDADPDLTARTMLQVLVEAKALQIKYRMLVSKTLQRKD